MFPFSFFPTHLFIRNHLYVACFVVVLAAVSGCGGSKRNDPPQESNQFCAPAAVPTTYSEQYLYGADIQESPYLWGYKIDNSTGALTAMPWSPIQTFRNPHAGIGHPSGNYLYLVSDNPFQTIDRVLETYSIGANGLPTFVQYREFGFPSGIAFDPSGKQLLVGSGFGDTAGPSTATNDRSALQSFTISDTGMPVPTSVVFVKLQFGSTFGFKKNGAVVIWGHTSSSVISNGAVHVYTRSCSTGQPTDKTSFAYDKGLRFVAVPPDGDYFIGFDCLGPNPGAQVFKLDPVTLSVSAVPNGFIPGVCWLTVSPSGRFLAAAVHENPTDQFSPFDVIVLYRFDAVTGAVAETDRFTIPPDANGVHAETGIPVFNSGSKFLYVSDINNDVLAFQVNETSGKLTPVQGSP